MTTPSDAPSDGQPASPTRQRFLAHLVALPIKPTVHKYYVRWAEAWTRARGDRSADATTAFFEALGRSTHLADWQFRQAVDAVQIFARDIFALPWVADYDWQGISNQARSMAPDPHTPGHETIRVSSETPAPASRDFRPLARD